MGVSKQGGKDQEQDGQDDEDDFHVGYKPRFEGIHNRGVTAS